MGVDLMILRLVLDGICFVSGILSFFMRLICLLLDLKIHLSLLSVEVFEVGFRKGAISL